MEFEGYSRIRKSPDLAPLIDVVFLLLVFFMLTGSFKKETVQKLLLPESASEGLLSDSKEPAVITVTGEGAFFLDERKVSGIQELGELLKKRKEKSPGLTVHLKADRNTVLQTVLHIMDAVREAGVEDLNLISEPKR